MTRPPEPAGARAKRIEVGPQALSRLPGADYADAFRIRSGTGRTAEQWARRVFESRPSGPRRVFSFIIWQGVLGLRLAPPDSPGHIAGWALAENEPGLLVMHADSRLMVGRMVLEVSGEHVTWTTLLGFERAAARPVWALTGYGHRALYRYCSLAPAGRRGHFREQQQPSRAGCDRGAARGYVTLAFNRDAAAAGAGG